MRIRLTNPPVTEVVLTVYFDPVLKSLRNEHVGRFWSSIESEFPRVEQKPPLSVSNDESDGLVVSDEVFPMPRFWFISRDNTEVVQIHKQAFTYNWRNYSDNPYPGFHERVMPAFDRYSEELVKFLRGHTNEHEPLVNRCELTYVNTIEQCEYWSGPDDTASVIPKFSLVAPIVSGDPTFDFNHMDRYQCSSTNQAQIAVRSARLRTNPETRALILQFEVTGNTGGTTRDNVVDWFVEAHDQISGIFLEVTNPEIRQQYWGSNE